MALGAVKKTIDHLPKREQRALLHWLDEREQLAWDEEIKKDFSPCGRGMPLIEKVKAEVRSGKFKLMKEVRRVRTK